MGVARWMDFQRATPNSYSARRSAWRLRPGSCRQSPNTRVTKFVTVFQYTTGAVLALME